LAWGESPIDLLGEYFLELMPSFDSRLPNAAEDIYVH
jgi:hypothetical protein